MTSASDRRLVFDSLYIVLALRLMRPREVGRVYRRMSGSDAQLTALITTRGVMRQLPSPSTRSASCNIWWTAP